MSRPQRGDTAGTIHHVTLRGHDRSNVFHHDEDCHSFLSRLDREARSHGCALNAYCFMRNHVHLILTVQEELAMRRVMQFTASGHSRRMNRLLGRSGALWDQRYWSEPLQDSERVATCHFYIESNPVRAGIVDEPDAFPWSSYLVHAHPTSSIIVLPSSWYNDLGQCPLTRQTAYQRLMAQYLDSWRVRCQA